MTIGPLPDWVNVNWMVGDYEGTPTLIAVDEDGNMIALMTGEGPLGLDTIALDGGGRIIAVIRDDTSDNYIAIDDSGFITAVLKGQFGTLFKTIRVDTDGRMEMIPVDPADIWGNAISMGNAELAACLGPAKRYDRRGNVVMIEDFSCGWEEWVEAKDGALAAVALSSDHYKTSPFGLKLTAGSDGTKYASVYRQFNYIGVPRIGFEFSFSIATETKEIAIEISIDTGVTSWKAGFYFDKGDGEVQYLNSSNVETKLVDVPTYPVTDPLYYTMKGVIDCVAGTYLRLLLGGTEHPMSDKAMYEPGGTVYPIFQVQVFHFGTGTGNPYIHIDDLILTVNEPTED